MVFAATGPDNEIRICGAATIWLTISVLISVLFFVFLLNCLQVKEKYNQKCNYYLQQLPELDIHHADFLLPIFGHTYRHIIFKPAQFLT